MFQAVVMLCGLLNGQPHCAPFAANDVQKTKTACEEHLAASLPGLIEELAAQGFTITQHEATCINKGAPA